MNVNEHTLREQVMSEDHKEVLAMALRERIKQHTLQAGRCQERIEACRNLSLRDPGSAKLLQSVIATWGRIREYHLATTSDCRGLLRDLRQPETLA